MQLELFDFETNKPSKCTVSSISKSFQETVQERFLEEEKLKRAIDNLTLTADQKAIVSKISDFTIKAGSTVIAIGRKILEFTLLFFKKFPATSFGAIAGLVVASFVPAGTVKGFAVPIVTSLFGLLKKLIVLFALGAGLREDLKNTAIGMKIAEATANIRKSMEN